jgi:hypothetical protein
MRLWSLHPRYLDRQGLTAGWREGLLAQAVLAGRTRGYTRHPQLTRFRAQPAPVEVVGDYLHGLATEATSRGYRYDTTKIEQRSAEPVVLPVTCGQLAHEWVHLVRKVETRSPDWLRALRHVERPDPHPLFRVVPGPVEDWEVLGDR